MSYQKVPHEDYPPPGYGSVYPPPAAYPSAPPPPPHEGYPYPHPQPTGYPYPPPQQHGGGYQGYFNHGYHPPPPPPPPQVYHCEHHHHDDGGCSSFLRGWYWRTLENSYEAIFGVFTSFDNIRPSLWRGVMSTLGYGLVAQRGFYLRPPGQESQTVTFFSSLGRESQTVT